ncbi:hypothetical protein GCM10025770_21290 [Viridibacterium curvum]|uniref:Uncharacterized protein n=2 Tax=Viridibacterium curvum TaxID=1101404 RepID=A0ABP9QQ73_9RHOO
MSRWLAACLLILCAPAVLAAGAPSSCTIGGYFVMVFGGAFLDGRTSELRDSLANLVGNTIDGQSVVWKTLERDGTELYQSISNIAGDLSIENPDLNNPETRLRRLLDGRGTSGDIALRDLILPDIGEFLAKSSLDDEGVRVAADNAYQQIAAEIQTGKRVLLIAHSDATLIMQAVYQKLTGKFGQDKVSRYSIAPISTAGGSYILAGNDRVLEAVNLELGNKILSNATSLTSNKDVMGHDPLRVYLDTNSGLRDRIRNDILAAIKGVTPTTSPSSAGRFIVTARPSGKFNTMLHHTTPTGSGALGPSTVEIDAGDGFYGQSQTAPCDMTPEQSGTYKFSVWFGSDAKPGDSANISITRPGAGTQSLTIKAPTTKYTYDDGTSMEVVNTDLKAITSFNIKIEGGEVVVTADTPTYGTAAITSKRNTWRESERLVGLAFNSNPKFTPPEYKEQQPYFGKKFDSTRPKGTTIPDWVQVNGATVDAIEVKNYDLRKNKNGLIAKLTKQVNDRRAELPPGSTQQIRIDISGQKVNSTDWTTVRAAIENIWPAGLTGKVSTLVGQPYSTAPEAP